jgi:hypothetical protein
VSYQDQAEERRADTDRTERLLDVATLALLVVFLVAGSIAGFAWGWGYGLAGMAGCALVAVIMINAGE